MYSLKKISIITCAAAIGIPSACSNQQNQTPPNIIIIMADDLGYSDIGCYGGEIETPNIDMLADNGLRFTQFYNASRCCPTRASFISGLYPHQAGMAINGQSLSRNAVTIAEVLREYGYQTGMTGKWHLSETKAQANREDQLRWISHRADYGDFAPLETYPHNRGFDEFWGVIWGVANFFDPFSLVHNEKPIKEVPEDFYVTDFITYKSLDLIEDFSKSESPFFLFVSHLAPHWPLHALPEDIEKYKGMYDDGWDVLRETRYRNMLNMGLFDEATTPLAPNESGLLWEDCERKEWESAHMEVHAAMVDRMDQGIGQIIDQLREKGMLDNTLIMFLSDNGASPERGYRPGFDKPGHTRNAELIVYDTYDIPGPEKTWPFLGRAWAGAVNSPFRYWKVEAFEGGVCTPLVVHWPDRLKTTSGSITHEVGHVMDIMATCLEVAGASYPENFQGNEIIPMEGISLLPVFEDRPRNGHKSIGWEHVGARGFREGDWKISALRQGQPWELFNLAEDRTETNDLSGIFPEKVQALEQKWFEWANRVGLELAETE